MPVFNEIDVQNNSNIRINEIKVFIRDLITFDSITLTTSDSLNTELIYTGDKLIIDTMFGSSGEYEGYIDISYSKPGELITSCERRLLFKPINACFVTIQFWEVDITAP
jgi:hypothetical protein